MEGVLYGIEARFGGLLTQCPKKGQMYTEWCRLTSSKSDIIDIYREKSRPEN